MLSNQSDHQCEPILATIYIARTISLEMAPLGLPLSYLKEFRCSLAGRHSLTQSIHSRSQFEVTEQKEWHTISPSQSSINASCHSIIALPAGFIAFHVVTMLSPEKRMCLTHQPPPCIVLQFVSSCFVQINPVIGPNGLAMIFLLCRLNNLTDQ